MRFIASLCLLLASCVLYAQRETSNWFLKGTSNFVEPAGVSTGRPFPSVFDGVSPTSVSDATGNLLFACDGNIIVNRNLVTMPGMVSGNLGGSRGKVLAQKIPGSTRYLVFYSVANNPSAANSAWTIRYAIVDMSLNGGLGDVVSTNHLVGANLSPGFTLVGDDVTGDGWLVTHMYGTDQFRNYRITAAGFSTTAVGCTAGTLLEKTDYIFRELKTSPNGRMIAGFSYIDHTSLFAYTRQHVEVFNFDFATGQLSYKVRSWSLYSYFSTYHTIEFSADNRLLYAGYMTRKDGLQPCGFGASRFIQFNLCYTDSVEFSRFCSYLVNQNMFCLPWTTYGKIQMGADKQIHMPYSGRDVSLIEFPNRIGTSASYRKSAYQVAAGNNNDVATPAFQHRDLEKATINNIIYNGGCYPDPARFEVTNDAIARIEWDFGDPASGGSNLSTLLKPSHVFSAPGIYTVTAELFGASNLPVETIFEKIEIKDPDKRLLYDYPADTAFCAGGELKIRLDVINGIFHWYQKTEDGTNYGWTISDSITLSSSGTYYVDMRQNDCDGCRKTDSIKITVLPRPSFSLGPDRQLCVGDSLKLEVYDPAARFLWSDGATDPMTWVKQPGIVWAQGEYDNNGCPFRDSILVVSLPAVEFSLPGDTTLCNNSPLLLSPGVRPATYLWQDGSSRPDFTVTSSGKYRVKVTSNEGCSRTDSIIVSYVTAENVSLGSDSVLCQGQSLLLQANVPSATYLWSTGVNSSQVSVNQTGEYWVRVDNGTCTVTDTIAVRFDLPPALSLGADTSVCSGEQLLLSPAISNSSYLWQDGSTAVTQSVRAPGRYWLQLTRGGCTVSDTVNINFFPLVPVLLGPDVRVCLGETAAVSAGSGFDSYVWNNGATTPGITLSVPGTYSVAAVTTDGCTSRDTVRFLDPYVLPVVQLDKNNELCYNSSRVLDAGAGFRSYSWNDGSTGRTITVNSAGTYSVTVTDNNGCHGTDNTSVTSILPLPAAFLPPDKEICQYETIDVKALGIYSNYRWSNNASTQSVSVSLPGVYILEVTDAKGCAGRDTITVFAKDCMEGVFIPSAFTPNRDGINDIFKPLVFGPVEEYRFIIFNRWGEVVFHTNNPASAWDGTFKGIPQDSHVFAWSCTYRTPGQATVTRKGTVALIR